MFTMKEGKHGARIITKEAMSCLSMMIQAAE